MNELEYRSIITKLCNIEQLLRVIAGIEPIDGYMKSKIIGAQDIDEWEDAE